MCFNTHNYEVKGPEKKLYAGHFINIERGAHVNYPYIGTTLYCKKTYYRLIRCFVWRTYIITYPRNISIITDVCWLLLIIIDMHVTCNIYQANRSRKPTSNYIQWQGRTNYCGMKTIDRRLKQLTTPQWQYYDSVESISTRVVLVPIHLCLDSCIDFLSFACPSNMGYFQPIDSF